jgi:sarcosine oxidase subunit beta
MSQASKTEVLVIGAGVVGSSVAMHLARLGASVRVVDFDLEGSLSSSELNAGGVRATWGQPINIEMAKHSIEYFASVAEEVGYRACGYLWLLPEDKLPGALRARELQTKMGWPVEAWDVPKLRSQVPFIDKTDGVAGCIFAPRDGLLNPNRLKNHFREEARARGAVFEDRLLVRSASFTGSRAKVVCERFVRALAHEAKVAVLSDQWQEKAEARVEFETDYVVNCAGAWASHVAKALGYLSPSFPVRRQACIFDCRGVDLTPYGMIVDTSGVYFHPEATNGLAGFATRDEKVGVNFEYGGESFFMEHIWPALYERATVFEALKHVTGWAGLYDVSPDECAIIGQVEQGDAGKSGRVFEAHSFSGHGVMHSYTAGLAIAESIAHGRPNTMDLSILSAKRFETGAKLHESAVI